MSKVKPSQFVAVAIVFLMLAPTTQAAKGFGPQWRDALAGVPVTVGFIGLVLLAAAVVVWVWTAGERHR